MKNNKEKMNHRKWQYIITSFLIVGTGIGRNLYLKNMTKKMESEHIVKNNNANDTNNINYDIIDVKDYAYSNILLEDNLNKFISHGKLLSNNFLYSKRDTSFNALELYIIDENGGLVQSLNIGNDNESQIELSSFTQLSDGSLVLLIEEYIPHSEISTFSLQKYNKNGELEFNKILDNSVSILKLYSFENLQGFISMESDSNGDINIVKYNISGEEIFRYKVIYDYNSNIDVIYQSDKIIFISMDNSPNIIELDNNGKEIRKTKIPYSNIRINKLFVTSDNGYIISLTDNNSNDKDIKTSYLKLDSNGNKEWIHLENSNSFTKNIYAIEDGYLLLGNDTYYKEKDDDFITSNLYSILKINNKGNKEWIKHIEINNEADNSIFTINGDYLENNFLIIPGILEDLDNNAYYIKFSVDKDGYISHIYDEDNDAVG